jgi:hypothetical protein
VTKRSQTPCNISFCKKQRNCNCENLFVVPISFKHFKVIFGYCSIIIGPSRSKAQQLLESYQAFLSERDHFNSSGQRLTTAAAIIRQDRANFHRFGLKDPGDESDRFFANADNRAALERMLELGRAESGVISRIVNSTPLVRVEVWQGSAGPFVVVTLIEPSRIRSEPQAKGATQQAAQNPDSERHTCVGYSTSPERFESDDHDPICQFKWTLPEWHENDAALIDGSLMYRNCPASCKIVIEVMDLPTVHTIRILSAEPVETSQTHNGTCTGILISEAYASRHPNSLSVELNPGDWVVKEQSGHHCTIDASTTNRQLAKNVGMEKVAKFVGFSGRIRSTGYMLGLIESTL